MKGYKNTTKTVYETESSDYNSGYRSGKEFYSKSRVAPTMTPSEKGGVAGKVMRGATRAMVVKPIDAAIKALSYTGTLTDNDGTKASPTYVKGLLQARKDVVGYAKGGKAAAKVGKVMGEFKAGALHSGSKKGPAVTNRKQAIAIGLSEARKAGAKIPMRKAEGGAVEVDLPTRAEPLKAQGLSSPKLPRVDDSRDFSTAFREARSAGDKTFSWRGKTYTTQLASEARSAPKAAAPAPKAAAPAPAPKAAAAPAPKAAAPAPAPKAAAPAPKAKPSFGQRVRDSYQSKEENDKEWSDRFSGVKDYLAKGDPKYRGMSRKDAFRAAFRDSMGKAEGGKVKAPPPKAKPYDPVKDEPTSRPLTADQVRNLRNQMKANPPKKPAKRPYDPVLDEPTSRPFKTGGYVKKQAGGLMAERELGAREMVGKAKGGAVAAVHKHERNMHPGKPLTKMRYGGKVGC